MGEILSGQNAPQLKDSIINETQVLTENALNYHKNTVYFPVRHHSPACSYHLKRVIAEYQPDCILIEGPENANDLLHVLTDSESKAPFALYYSFSDKSGIVSDNCEDYKCYYPFMDYSPELVALREGKRLNIQASFIDLPYREILAASTEGQGLRKDSSGYNDDYLMARSKYIDEICCLAGCRNFDELWEKHFEQNGFTCSTQEFVQRMLVYCLLSRMDTPIEKMEADCCLARESYMGFKISEAHKNYNKILVVTGGFHTCALAKNTQKGEIKLHKIGKGIENVYPMAYSMEAIDTLSGYASGMPAPAFYQMIWEYAENGESVENAYKNTVLNFLVKTGRKIRAKGDNISAFDETCAFDMAGGLADLRGKKSAGLFELKDSVLSCYVKGEYTISGSRPIQLLNEFLTGEKVGKMCADAAIPPIVTDFETLCRKFGIKTGSSLTKEVVLNIFSSLKHRQTAQFFYMLNFLEIDFADKIRGANLHTGRDKNLIRETWKYKWSTHVASELIDRSVHGGTIREACVNLTRSKLAKSTSAGECAELMVSAFEMGLADESNKMVRETEIKISNDGSFVSLADALNSLCGLINLRELYRAENTADLTPLIRKCSEKLVSMLPLMADIKDEDCELCSRTCRQLYNLSSIGIMSEYRAEIIDAFKRLVSANPVNSSVQGTVYGLIYGSDTSIRNEISKVCKGYIMGTSSQLGNGAKFLRGLFSSARDLIFTDGSLVEMIDTLLASADDETFMNILPDLRMAFAYFSPNEIDRIAQSAASIHGKCASDITHRCSVTPKLYKIGESIDKYAAEQINSEVYGV